MGACPFYCILPTELLLLIVYDHTGTLDSSTRLLETITSTLNTTRKVFHKLECITVV